MVVPPVPATWICQVPEVAASIVGVIYIALEVVVVNEKYGIRLTEIISPSERIERLK